MTESLIFNLNSNNSHTRYAYPSVRFILFGVAPVKLQSVLGSCNNKKEYTRDQNVVLRGCGEVITPMRGGGEGGAGKLFGTASGEPFLRVLRVHTRPFAENKRRNVAV